MSSGGGPDPPLPPEKLNELRKAVKEQLKSLGVNDQIKNLVAEKRNYKPTKGKDPGITKEQAIEELKDRGVIDQLVKSLNQTDIVEGGSFTNKRQPIRSVPSLGKRFLHIKIKTGSTFAIGPYYESNCLMICGELFGQRLSSKRMLETRHNSNSMRCSSNYVLTECKAEPPAFDFLYGTQTVATPSFESSALIELPGGTTAEPCTLLTHRQPLHLVVLQIQPASAAHAHTTPDASRMSTSPSTSSTASIGINPQQHSWGQPGASPPGHQTGSGPLHTANIGNASRAMVKSAPNAGTSYFLTATSAQHGQQQTPTRAAPPLHSAIDLLRFSSQTGVLGTCHVDWRQALACRGESSCIVQLAGPQGETVGHISLDLEVAPALAKPLDSAALKTHTEAESRRNMEASAGFSGRVQSWWQDYSRDALGHQPEGVARLIVCGEDGLQRSCCAFVRPLQLGRWLSTPREAARFVALLKLKQGGTGSAEIWSSLHTVVEGCQASQAEKALLLASLLLGYGLDAWVVFGTDAVGQHVWVLTRSSRDSVVFWDACTGSRYSPATAGQPKGCPFRSVACVFNQRRLYANLQAENGVAEAAYVFEDAGRWRELGVHAQDVPGSLGMRFDLQMHPFDTAAHEAKLEAEVKRALSEHREETLGLTSTHWDDGMAFLLMPSLAAYEQEAVTGQPAARSDDFQQCIRRSIPAGCMFKGFPQHHRVLCPSGIVQSMLKEAAVKDMLGTQAADTAFALRVKMFPYPEHVCSVWLMLALKYSLPRTGRVSKQDL